MIDQLGVEELVERVEITAIHRIDKILVHTFEIAIAHTITLLLEAL
jgi:hypothetical protein